MDHEVAAVVPARPDVSSWLSQALRLTAFPTPDAQLGEVTWWADLTGAPPETRTSQPRKGIMQQEGPFQGGVLTVKTEPLRIDWVLGKSTETIMEEDTMPVLGRLTETLPAFADLMKRWFALQGVPPMNRLALGAVLIQPVDTKEEGYRRLSSYLHNVRVEPELSSDLLYQINRRRPSRTGIPNLQINRLSKWSVALTVRRSIMAGPGGVSIAASEPVHACRLELDINTIPEYIGPLPSERRGELVDEFVDLSIEIAREGDIP